MLIKNYLKSIEKELIDIDEKTKKSIIQEISEHLDEKIEDVKKSRKVSELSPKRLRKILEEFGEPQEIAREYRRQLSEEQIPVSGTKKSNKKKVVASIIAVCVVLSLIFAIFTVIDFNDEKKDDKTIIPGKGLEVIQIGDDLDEVKDVFGEPEYIVDSNELIWVSYRYEKGIDFLISNYTDKIVEIRFNSGFNGALANEISIGSTLDDVLNESGDAKNTVQANLTETTNVLLGSDRVLYEQIYEGNLTAYKFVDAKKGILYWFDLDKTVTQIVVFRPY
jgi:hypothetical protein